MQMPLSRISVAQLKRAIAIKEQIEALEKELGGILETTTALPAALPLPQRKKRRMSAAGRARIAAAQKARWAKLKKAPAPSAKPTPKRKRRLSPEGRAKIIAAIKARWAKVKAAKEAAKKPKAR